MKLTTIAVDLAKSVFELAISEHPRQVSDRHRLSREAFALFFANRPRCLVVMEACGSAHYWARQIEAAGHGVQLLAPHVVRPYVAGNKTDRTDCNGLLEDADSGLPDLLRPALAEARDEVLKFERRMHDVERQLRTVARQLPAVAKLETIPGVGLLTATALVAMIGNVERFPTARHFASYLGLTPRERSSGLRRELGAISKRGDAYLRTLLTHGARSVLWTAKSREQPDRLRAWALRVQETRGHNKAAIAVANKITRIVWAVWRRDTQFIEMPAAA